MTSTVVESFYYGVAILAGLGLALLALSDAFAGCRKVKMSKLMGMFGDSLVAAVSVGLFVMRLLLYEDYSDDTAAEMGWVVTAVVFVVVWFRYYRAFSAVVAYASIHTIYFALFGAVWSAAVDQSTIGFLVSAIVGVVIYMIMLFVVVMRNNRAKGVPLPVVRIVFGFICTYYLMSAVTGLDSEQRHLSLFFVDLPGLTILYSIVVGLAMAAFNVKNSASEYVSLAGDGSVP